jgi:GT2 family glycosyltransferase
MIAPAVAALTTVNGYLLALLAAAARTREAPCGAPPRLHFAIVIPARDEEATIGGTLAALAELEHPPELVEVIVVADNCADDTAIAAARAGATVWTRSGGGGGKGGALAWALGRLAGALPDVDAVVVVDADCAVTPNLLTAVEARIRAGASVVQVAYLVGNPDASAVAALRYASFALVNLVRPLGKARLGLSAGLFGTGMAFRRELLARHPWASHSLVEDQEQHLRLVAAGERVMFAPEARVVSAMPTTLRRSSSQQLRWDAGRARLIRTWTPRLLAAGLRRRDAAQLHAALEPLVPPQSLLLAANLAAALLALRAGPVLRRVAAGNLAGQAAFVAGGLVLVRSPATVWRSLACAPALVAWKLALLVRLWSGRGPTRWVRTEREP